MNPIENIHKIIKEKRNILLHCHPGPDEDSVGSALAMKLALEQMGKQVTVIAGDDPVPSKFSFLPGYDQIVSLKFSEVDLSKFDVFIIQDSSNLDMISKEADITFPQELTTIVIDHHQTNQGYGDINYIDSSCPATAEILFTLFSEWRVEITSNIATCLLTGIYGDTKFIYPSTTAKTYNIVSKLVELVPNFSEIIFNLENSSSPFSVKFLGLALSKVETLDRLAYSLISKEDIEMLTDTGQKPSAGEVANHLISVIGWEVGICGVEDELDVWKLSFRTRDSKANDVSTLATKLGIGGGHKAAAGCTFSGGKQELLSKLETLLK